MTPTEQQKKEVRESMPRKEYNDDRLGDWAAHNYDLLSALLAPSEPMGWQTIENFEHDGSCVDLLLNGNARVPDCYFDYYTKEWLMSGTDVPVLRQDDPINKITHAMRHLPLPPPPKGAAS